MSTPEAIAPRRAHPLALATLAVAVVAALLALLSGPGYRVGLWDVRMGLTLFRWSGTLAVLAVVLGLPALLLARAPRRGRVHAAIAIAVGALLLVPLLGWRSKAKEAPPIHDITTDTDDPPPFVAVKPLRADAPNPAEYEGDSIAALQKAAYPDIRPLMLALPLDSAFSVARTAAEDMGWEMVDAVREEGRIEATDRTLWFGFADDVVIRVRPESGIARVDVRSVSRVGRGDVGTNAARIRAYAEKLAPYTATGQ